MTEQDTEPKLHHWGGPQIGVPDADITDPAPEQRSKFDAMKRGAARRCPCCGQKGIMHGYLKVTDKCSQCGLEAGSFRLDDGPAYLTLLIGGHILALLMAILGFTLEWPDAAAISFWLVLTIVVMGTLLPLIKGAYLGLLWANGVKG